MSGAFFKRRQKMTVWVKLSDPVYQFPEIIADSPRELAEKCGVSKTTIYSSWCRYVKGEAAFSRYMKIEINEGEEDE